ncbi:MAG: YraN family protein [Alphaproteobacteria bacterium]|nr:YraN family protein [Alphaproteobacteria bacterium]
MAPNGRAAARRDAARPGTRHARGRRAERAGRAAEALCARVLEAAGFAILAQRLRTAAGEIDLLARRDGLVLFVEVKARMSAADGAEAVSPAQRRRLVAAAEIALAERPELAGCDCRFDVMIALPEGAPIWLEGAFRADD